MNLESYWNLFNSFAGLLTAILTGSSERCFTGCQFFHYRVKPLQELVSSLEKTINSLQAAATN